MPAMQPTKNIWFNGTLVPWEQANIHVLTHGLHYGTGYFEGIRAYRTGQGTSAVFRLKEHMQRFINSGKIMGIQTPYDLPALEQAVIDTLESNQLPGAYIRPLGFVGYGNLGVHPGDNPIQTIVAAWEWGAYLGEAGLDAGVRLKTSSFNRFQPNSLMSKAKCSGNYVNSVLAKTEAVRDGYDEALMLDVNGFVAECSGENFFIVRGNKIKTSPLMSVLEGINRDSVLTLARELGYDVVETQFTRDEVYIADEAFMTGTAAEITPVREVDNRTIGAGKAGPVAKALQKAFFDVVEGKNPKYANWLTPYKH